MSFIHKRLKLFPWSAMLMDRDAHKDEDYLMKKREDYPVDMVRIGGRDIIILEMDGERDEDGEYFNLRMRIAESSNAIEVDFTEKALAKLIKSLTKMHDYMIENANPTT